MEQLNKVNKDNKLLKRAYKKKAQQNQVLVAKVTQQKQTLATEAKISTKITGTKTTKVGNNPSEIKWQIVKKNNSRYSAS